MIVKSTEIKNNFGKYLKLLDKEDIIVTKSGSPVARITKQNDWRDIDRVCEQAVAYGSDHDGIKMTFEEFLEMREKTEDRYEYIDGMAFYVASPVITHQRILGNLHIIFRLWFKGKKCMPYFSPFDVILKKGENNMNLVQPDLLLVCDSENKNEQDRYTGIPTLVIEILSHSSTRMDLVRKLDLYMQTGVKEYWIVNHYKREVIIYQFKDNDIEDFKVYSKEGVVESFTFDGFSTDMTEIFE